MPDTPTHDPLLSVADAAKYLGVSRRSIYNLFASGDLERVNLGRSTQPWQFPGSGQGSVRPAVRIRLSSLTAYVDRNDRSKK
jgi:excisionase family DNA binding protein